ncbi:TonB-dependent receptor domain-containing protein [Psittacicella hinzii]|nr:TonB-dependent receptor [Psittacicella hinzii]
MQRTFTLTLVASALAAMTLGVVHADTTSTTLSTITVTGTNTATTNTLTTTTANLGTLKSFFGNDLSVSVTKGQRQRDGEASINIRGLQGNRVALTLDGVSLGEGLESRFWSGKLKVMSWGRGVMLETTALKSAILDLAGNKQGSLGASIDFRTLDPADIRQGKAQGGYVYGKYDSTDSSYVSSLAYAWQWQNYEGSILTTYRQGHEVKNNSQAYTPATGTNRQQPNPQDNKRFYLLTKHFYSLNEQQRLGLTYEYLRDKSYTNELSNVGFATVRRVSTYTDYAFTNDKNTRQRVSFSHDYTSDNLLVQSSLTYAVAKTRNYRENATASTSSVSANMAFTTTQSRGKYEFKTLNLSSQAVQRLGALQTLRYGLVLERNVANFGYTQTVGNTVSSYKPIPKSQVLTTNLYFIDELKWQGLTVKPTLSFMHYSVKPRTSDGYTQAVSLTGSYGSLTKVSKTRLLPKLYLDYKVASWLVPYAQLSLGYRIPSVQQLYGYFNRGNNTYLLGNPNLKAESSRNFELGFKGQTPDFNYQVSGFVSKYKNFITRRIDSGIYFTYTNADSAKTYGLTFNGKARLSQDLYLQAGLAWTRGNQHGWDQASQSIKKTGLNSVDPLRTNLALSYERQDWSARVNWTWTDTRQTSDLNVGTSMYNPTTAYSKVDVDLYWRPSANLELGVGVSNLFNAQYVDWSDISYYYTNFFEANGGISGVNADNWKSFTQLGRTYYVTAKYSF